MELETDNGVLESWVESLFMDRNVKDVAEFGTQLFDYERP